MRITCTNTNCGRIHDIPASGNPWTVPATKCACGALVARFIYSQGPAQPTGRRAFPFLPPFP